MKTLRRNLGKLLEPLEGKGGTLGILGKLLEGIGKVPRTIRRKKEAL